MFQTCWDPCLSQWESLPPFLPPCHFWQYLNAAVLLGQWKQASSFPVCRIALPATFRTNSNLPHRQLLTMKKCMDIPSLVQVFTDIYEKGNWLADTLSEVRPVIQQSSQMGQATSSNFPALGGALLLGVSFLSVEYEVHHVWRSSGERHPCNCMCGQRS